MDWTTRKIRKLRDKELELFRKEQGEKNEQDFLEIKNSGHENFHDWDREQNADFAKKSLIIILAMLLTCMGIILI